ncbi:MAG: M20 family metallopeptidase [Mycobacteriaceae bacterium]|nr:M20 family metallopeptidase [Mycobacteriaceae bacterium]
MPASSPPRRQPATAACADVARDVVLARRDDLIALSHDIHAEPELAFTEHRSCAKTQALAAERGFTITRAPAGLDTAFRADFGDGDLRVAVCAEYDALPDIGHACGHNIIAAAAVGATLALADVADELGLRVVLMGTPAEESGGGKVLLLKAGVFDDISAAVMIHPGPADIAAARSLALAEVAVEYQGHESHASVAPYLGVNAADAATVAQVAIGLLRQHLAPGQQVHGIMTAGGRAPNVIPAHAAMRYAMRATNRESLRSLEKRVLDCFGAGGLATGCECRINEGGPPYDELRPDPWLASVFREEMARCGRVPAPEQLEAALPVGSTDMGNITQAIPGIHPIVSVEAGGASLHQPEFTAAAASESADEAVIDGSIMLARTVIRLAETLPERERVLRAQVERAGS